MISLKSIFTNLFNKKTVNVVAKATEEAMPTFRASVTNSQILYLLKTDHNIIINSAFKLHKIMEKMGIIEKIGQGWLLSENGRIKFTGWRSRVVNPTLWKPEIVEAIAEYIEKNNIDVTKINRNW